MSKGAALLQGMCLTHYVAQPNLRPGWQRCVTAQAVLLIIACSNGGDEEGTMGVSGFGLLDCSCHSIDQLGYQEQ